MENASAPINRIPPDVLSLIPDYWAWESEGGERDAESVKLTHVCRSWRVLFTSRPSLWTRLDCANVDKTRTYIERSRSSPLEVYLGDFYDCQEEAVLLVAPHAHRLKTLVVYEDQTEALSFRPEHFSAPAPGLKILVIHLTRDEAPSLPDKLFDGDLSSLRDLTLVGVVTPLPWRGMSNLTTFDLSYTPENGILLTQLLDFFESAPRLSHVYLHNSIPGFSNAPTQRVLSMAHLESLTIIAQPVHSILLNHLSIPAGAAVFSEFSCSDARFPIQSYLSSLDNLRNLSHIAAVNLRIGPEYRAIRLSGPSGELHVRGMSENGGTSQGTKRFLRSLDLFNFSRCQWLAVTLTAYELASSIAASYQLLDTMKAVRILTLSQCTNLPFISALDPDKCPDQTVLCPELEEIVLYINDPKEVHINQLLKMAKMRASRRAKLSAVTITVVNGVTTRPEEVFQLREHVSRVEYRMDVTLPQWDALPV